MNAGKLRHQVIIQKPNATRDAYGAEIAAWATHATVWANIRPAAGQEVVVAGSTESRNSHVVSIRYRSDILASYRVLFGTRVLAINSFFDPQEKTSRLEMRCTEVSA